MPDDDDIRDDGADGGGPRSLWSGSITFGLLSLRVDLFPAVRNEVLPLKMVDDHRRLLTRRYFCPEHQKPLARDEIVRGFEADSGEYLIVDDEDLESLAPEKSRAIDLRRFVELTDIDPMYFKRSYFLTPADDEASRAYRLLAESMERSGRAGVATFVMRGKEYLVALLAEGGLLRAETLRFKEELREPAQAGLPLAEKPDAKSVARFRKAIEALAAERVERDELVDERTAQLKRLIDDKLEKGVDVERIEVDEEAAEEAEIIDLMEVLKRRLAPLAGGETRDRAAADGRSTPRKSRAGRTTTGKSTTGKSTTGKSTTGSSTHGKSATGNGRTSRPQDREALETQSREALYERAKALRVPGRSKMSKAALVKALREARG